MIDHFKRYIEYDIISEEDRKKTHIFDTFFYHCLTQSNPIKKTKEEIANKLE